MRQLIITTVMLLTFLTIPFMVYAGNNADTVTKRKAIEVLCNLSRKSFEMGAKLRCKGVSKTEALLLGKDIVKESVKDIEALKNPDVYSLAEDMVLIGVRAAYKVPLDCDKSITLQSLMIKEVCISELGKKLGIPVI